MNALRKIGLFIFGLLLFITLPLNTLVWTTRNTIFDRMFMIGFFEQSGLYEDILDTLGNIAQSSLKNNEEAQIEGGTSTESGNMPDTSTLIKAAKVAFPPNVIQQNVEEVLNYTYDQLEGKTGVAILNIDLNDEKKAFIEALGNEAITRAASLPTCTTQLTSDFDPLSSSCIPSGVNVSAQADKIKNELSANKDFFSKTTISSADITINKQFQKAFVNARDSVYVTTAATIVFAVLVFILGKNRRSGLKINAWLFGLAGLWAILLGSFFQLSSSLIANKLAESYTVLNTSGASSVSDPAIVKLISRMTSTIFTWHMIIGGAYLAVMVLCIIAIKTMKGKSKKSAPTPSQTPPEEPKTAQATKTPAPTAKKPAPNSNKTKLVQ